MLANCDRWGEMEVDDRSAMSARSPLHSETYKTLAAIVGAALARERAVGELGDAARIIENSATILFRFDAEQPYPISYVSRNISRYGYDAEEMRTSPLHYLELIHPDDRPKAIDDVVRIADGRPLRGHAQRPTSGGGRPPCLFECRITPMRDKGGRVTEIEGLGIDIDHRTAADS